MIFLLQATSPEDINFGAMLVRMLIFLGLTVLLIVILLKKVLPLLVAGGRRAETNSIRVLERIPIDQRKSLLVVEIQERIYLLGSAEGQINILMELDREKVLASHSVPARPTSFAEVLKKTLSRNKSQVE